MDSLRRHLIALLQGGQAYDTFEDIVAEFDDDQWGVIPPGAEHSAWQIVEHLRFSLQDILDYSQNEKGDYREFNWPDDYWAKSPLPDNGTWRDTVQAYREEIRKMEALVLDESRDLFAPFPWAPDHTLLREVLLAADHAGYHLGQMVELKRFLGSAKAATR